MRLGTSERLARVLTAVAVLALLPGPTGAAGPARRISRPRPPVIPKLIVPGSASSWDLAVGHACQRALGRAPGAVVALDPRTGRVLTVVNPKLALFRAYQPCSVFKIVVAVAALSEGVVTPETTLPCRRGCWMWTGHGPIDLRRALAVSCNPYFQQVGEELGYTTIQRYAHLLGLGVRSGINLTGETAGHVPASVGPEDVALLSSHAEGVTASAVQLAVLLAASINGGIVFQPQVSGPEGFVPRERWRLPEGTSLSGLAEGFLAAVNEGSATEAFDPEVSVAGKTGTCSRAGWFASYAPAERPELVTVVFLRRGSGHSASAVAGRIYQELYRTASGQVAAGGS